jgi:hypothetical protein
LAETEGSRPTPPIRAYSPAVRKSLVVRECVRPDGVAIETMNAPVSQFHPPNP